MANLRRSLLFRLTVPCLFTVLAFGVGYTAFWSTKYENLLQERFFDSGARSTNLFAEAVAEALWEFDAGSADRILTGLAEVEGFSYAAIYDSAGVFADFTPAPSAAPPPDLTQLQTKSARFWIEGANAFYLLPIVHPQHGELGSLITVFSLQPMIAKKWEARRAATLGAITAFGLLSMLLVGVARSVILPLARITTVIENVAAGRTDQAIPHRHRLDEVGRLARALEVFRQNAASLIAAQTDARLNRRIAELALTDDLTGLSNRRAVQKWFAKIDQDNQAGHKQAYALLHLDLDGFKQINDTLGHHAGDFVIKSVAGRLKEFEDRFDMIARIGGDEFMMALRQGDGQAPASAIAAEVISRLREPLEMDGQLLRFGSSIGIAKTNFGDKKMAETLVNADIALYRAKSEGKGRAVEFNALHRHEMAEKKKLSDEIFLSLEHGDFIPYFHPIVDAQTHHISGLELLARWKHPVYGVLPPARFLGVANDLNLMRHIDRQVLESAVEALSSLSQIGLEIPSLSINVSASRLIEPDFLETMGNAVTKGVRLNLELLETMYVDDLSSQVGWQLDQIREMGIGLHIDDFGTGHSSIAGLLKVAPDKLKIDKQFVLPALEDEQARDLVKIIIAIADLLSIDVVAEGVETKDHASLMCALGASALQGFYFARPMPFSELHRRLNDPKALVTAKRRAK